MKKEITFKINGEERTALVNSNEVLLEFIRDKLGIKSPKYGCGRGDCGTCTVIMNGKTVRSCLVLAIEADGREILTLEGLSKDGLTPLQKSFIDHNSFQCGFCAPGMILNATELLEENPNPTREDVKEHLSGNLCRCTGYDPIVDAVLDASKKK